MNQVKSEKLKVKSSGESELPELKGGVNGKQLSVLRHSLGYDDAGEDRFAQARSMDERRNRFVTGPGSDDYETCRELVAKGLMTDLGAFRMIGGDHVFHVTGSGIEVVLMNKPAPIKLSRGRKRYLEFLRADTGMRFGDWLKRMNSLRRFTADER